MVRPLRIQFPGAFYHITCRGIERRKIFMDDNDRSRFFALLTGSLETYQVVLHAYIMMTNHFHLLIQTKKANCSEFMRHFNICYTGWFNWRHNRCGNLYQGRYKAYLVDADNYLLEVSRYLHLNSVRVRGMGSLDYREKWRYARDYGWSSLPGYVSERRAIPMINSVREQPSYRDLVVSTLEPEVVVGILQRECGISEESLKVRNSNGVMRGIAAELLYKYCEITQAQIGHLLGDIDYMSVSQLRRRLKEKMNQDVAVRKKYAEVEAKLKRLMYSV
jgi:REP element-mobilizing transposase RayT/DNA-binding Xre family transcriptional regulator